MVNTVELSKRAAKQLRKLPRNIVNSFKLWTTSIEEEGLMQTRRVPGHKDEALKGKLSGLRSVRLNEAYRAIYQVVDRERNKETVKVVRVERVDKHEY